MGKKKKETFADKLKASLSKAGDEVAKATKKTLEVAKESAEVVAEQTAKAAKASAKAAKASAHLVAEKAEDAKTFVDGKSREMLDKAYEKKRAIAVERVSALRAKFKEASPAEIQAELEKELHSKEEKLGSDSDTFSSAVTAYVLASFEVHGAKPTDSEASQKYIDTMLVIDSEISKNIQLYGGLAIELLASQVKTVGKVAKLAINAGNKLSRFQPLIQLLGIKNIGKQSISMIVISATKSQVGVTPEAWI